MTKAQAAKIKQLLPLVDAIRARCLDCSAGSSYEVKMCPCRNCPLFNFREGLPNFTREKSTRKAQNVSEGEGCKDE